MKEGFWINYRTGKVFPIGLHGDHETWLRDPANAEALGVSARVSRALKRFRPGIDRDTCLLHAIQNAPIMRVRGHVESVTFEHAARNDRQALTAIRRFATSYLGPQTLLRVVNHHSGVEQHILVRDITGKENGK